MANRVTIYFHLKDPDCGERLARQLDDPPRAWKISSHDGSVLVPTLDPLSIYCVHPDGTSTWQGVFRKGYTHAA